MNRKMCLLCCVLAALLSLTALAADTVHEVFTIVDLKQLADSRDTFYLRNDLDLSSYGDWTPINFYGVFDGQGHTIKGLTVSVTDAAGGLFNELHGTVQNLRVEGNVTVKRDKWEFVAHPDHPETENHQELSFEISAGILAAYLGKEGRLFRVSTDGNITGDSDVGGLVGGCHRNSVMSDCFSTANVTHKGDDSSGGIGGLIGWLAGGDGHSVVAQNCYASGTVTAPASYLGANGFIGVNDGGDEAVSRCFHCNYRNPKAADSATYQTPEDMKQQATYTGWDFSEVWRISPTKNQGFPYLRDPAKIAPASVSLDASNLTLEPDDSYTLQAAILPMNATSRHLDWYSSDKNVVELKPAAHSSAVEINARMTLIAKAPGVAVVTARNTEGKLEAACTVTVSGGEAEAIPDYRLNGITIQNPNGAALNAIPSGSFLATVSVTHNAAEKHPVILLAAYKENAQFAGLFYVTLKSPVGGTVEATLPIDNADGKITQLKAFAVSSLGDMRMMADPVAFPKT